MITNETIKTIMERYSCRSFTGEPLPRERIDALVEAALASPSAMNRQPWRVIVITDKALIDELDAECLEILKNADDKSSYERISKRGGKVYYNAPCMFLVLSDGSEFGACDCGILSENIALCAQSMGLGNVICGMAGIPLNGPNGEKFIKRLKFPEGFEFSMGVLAGAANTATKPHPLDFSKVSWFQ